jgi:hypothetical protein
MNFNEMQPDELFLSSYLNEYKNNIEAVWWQLVRLNSNVFVLDKIAAFRFDLFGDYSRNFWELSRQALFEASVMAIFRRQFRSYGAGSVFNFNPTNMSRLRRQ